MRLTSADMVVTEFAADSFVNAVKDTTDRNAIIAQFSNFKRTLNPEMARLFEQFTLIKAKQLDGILGLSETMAADDLAKRTRAVIQAVSNAAFERSGDLLPEVMVRIFGAELTETAKAGGYRAYGTPSDIKLDAEGRGVWKTRLFRGDPKSAGEYGMIRQEYLARAEVTFNADGSVHNAVVAPMDNEA